MNDASQLPFFELVFFGYFFGQCKKVTAACIRQKPTQGTRLLDKIN
jgi:hypothetical protein